MKLGRGLRLLLENSKTMAAMDPESRKNLPSASAPAPAQKPDQTPAEPPHHHPVPSGLVRLYGLFAVLFVLLPEWMADLRQMSRNVRIQAHGDVDQDRLSLTLRRRLAARRRRELRPGAPKPASPRPMQQAAPVAPRRLAGVARAALLVGVGAGLVWGAGQLKLERGPGGQVSLRPAISRAPATRLAAAVPEGKVRLSAVGPSWVEVRTLEGHTIYGAILTGRVELPMGPGLKVLAGRPDLVRISQGSQPPRPLGSIDHVMWQAIEPLAPAEPPAPAQPSP